MAVFIAYIIFNGDHFMQNWTATKALALLEKEEAYRKAV